MIFDNSATISLLATNNAANEKTPTEGSSGYYLADANYNVTGLVKYDSNAQQWNVAERYTYDPYGEVTYCDSTWTAYTNQVSAYSNTTLYAGRTLDTATSLYYNRARYYDASLERFISRDPIGYKGGINVYEYVGDNPLARIDPHGTRSCAVTSPPVILPGSVTTIAYGGGLGVGVSTNPSVIGIQPVTSLTCVQRRVLNVQYTCTDTIRIFSWHCPPIWKTKTVTYTTYITQYQDRTYTVSIAPGFLYTTGQEVPVPLPGFTGPGPIVSHYALTESDQARGNQECASRAPAWPAYTPPPTAS